MSTSRSETILRATSNDMTVVSLVVSISRFVSRLRVPCQSGNTMRISVELVTTIRVHIIPNAKIDTVVGKYGDAIKIKLRARPVEGKVNNALLSFLAEKLS